MMQEAGLPLGGPLHGEDPGPTPLAQDEAAGSAPTATHVRGECRRSVLVCGLCVC